MGTTMITTNLVVATTMVTMATASTTTAPKLITTSTTSATIAATVTTMAASSTTLSPTVDTITTSAKTPTTTTATMTMSTRFTLTPAVAVARSDSGVIGIGFAGGGVCIFALLGTWLRILYRRCRKNMGDAGKSDFFKPPFPDGPLSSEAGRITPRSRNSSQADTAPATPRTPRTPKAPCVAPRQPRFLSSNKEVEAMTKAFQDLANIDHMTIEVPNKIKFSVPPEALGHKSALAQTSTIIDVDDVGVDMDARSSDTTTFGNTHCGSRSATMRPWGEYSRPTDCNGFSVTELASMQPARFRDWWLDVANSCNFDDDVCDESVAKVRNVVPADRVEREVDEPPALQFPQNDQERHRDECCNDPMLRQSFLSERSGGFKVPTFGTEYSLVTTSVEKTVGTMGTMIIGEEASDDAHGATVSDEDVDGVMFDELADTIAAVEGPDAVNRCLLFDVGLAAGDVVDRALRSSIVNVDEFDVACWALIVES